MNFSQMLLFNEPQAQVATSPNRARLFYFGVAALLLTLMLLGFQQFYLHGKAFPNRELAQPIRTLLILHGIGMSAWVLLFLVQPLLIVAGNRRDHMMLGRIGAVLAACIVILGFRLGIESTLISPPDMRIWGLAPKQFMAVPIIGIMIFAGYVIVGVWNRRRPEVHRPVMLLATMAAMPAAVSRIDFISVLYHGTVWETVFGPFFGTLVIGAFFLVMKCLLTRSLNRWFAMGYAGLVVSSALIMQLATTSGWDHFASFLLR
ncbi:MAG: hypothetical protein WAV82_00970 [Methylobacter sp.]